jgi:membrane associated rhomboid family serine protease
MFFPLRDTQPSYSKPFVTMIIIVINVLVFLFQLSLDEYSLNAFIATYGLVPDRFSAINVITSMFLHGGWMHIIGNMWFLWIFGDNIEDILGHGKFLIFYLLCGIVAALAQVMLNPYSRVPMVGASGAIAGVMGSYLLKFPHARIETLAFIFIFLTRFDVPAWLMLILWFGTQLFSGVGSIGHTMVNEGGTAFFAHIGGFVAGMVLIKTMGTRENYWRRRDLHW